MADVWTNKKTTETSAWSSTGTAGTSTWTDSSSGSSSLGTATPAGSAIGTYDSAAEAATSLIGTKYHLFDRKEFFFGNDSDIRLSFDADNSGLLLRVFPPLSGAGTLLTIRNGDSDIFKIKGDRSMMLKRSYELPSGFEDNQSGFVFYNENLWIVT